MSDAAESSLGLPAESIRGIGDLRDRDQDWVPVLSELVYEGRLISVRRDELVNSDGSRFDRFTVEHPGAVGVLALDDDERVVLLEQYRTTVRQRLIQLPAGILDVPGEDPLQAARRELAEETGLVAQQWEPLLDVFPTPGISTERWRLYLARGLQPMAPTDRPKTVDEEADMRVLLAPFGVLEEALESGHIKDAMVHLAVRAAAHLVKGR